MVDDSILPENDGKTGDASKKTTVADDDDSKKVFSIEILRLIRNAQKQHGLRHGDYQRYRGNGFAKYSILLQHKQEKWISGVHEICVLNENYTLHKSL